MIKEERRKKRRRKIKLYIFLVVTMLMALAAFIVTNVFTVEQVVVEGNVWYSAKQIESMVLNDEYSWNSLYVNLKYRFMDVGEIPFVDEMEISLDNPHTVRIKVYEKGILGYLYIPILGQNAYFDKDGFVIETSSEVIPDTPRITGLSCNEVVLYEKLPLQDERVLRQLLNLTQILKKYDLQPTEIAFDKEDGVVLLYDGIEVIVGKEDYLSQKMIRLSHIMPELYGMQGTLHLENWTEETTDVVFDKEILNEVDNPVEDENGEEADMNAENSENP